MPRNRTIYQCEAIFAGPTPATGRHFTGGAATYGNVGGQVTGTNLVTEFYRVQTANYSTSIPRTDINQFGELAAIDRIILEQADVNLDFSYILANFSNEAVLGLTVSSGSQVSAISGILNKTQDERNYFIVTVAEGNDVAGNTATNSTVHGIGNAFLSSYSSEGSVGNFPTVTVNVQGLNMTVDAASTGQAIPAIFPADGSKVTGWFYSLPLGLQSEGGNTINANDLSLSALRPGDITLNLGSSEIGPDFTDMKIQSYNLSFDLNRTPLQKLGSKYAFAREIDFPVSVSLNVVADVGDSQTGNLVDVINRNTTYNPSVTIRKPGVGTLGTGVMCYYEIKGAKLDAIEYTSSIGPNKSVSLTFAAQLGGPQNVTQGLFISGSN
jgi:hypothetical protein